MKIEIGRTDAGFDVRVDGSFDGRIVTGMSTHETACDAAREAAGLLRVWATTEGDCKPMKSLWLVMGESDKDEDFARVTSADDRIGAVAVVAKALGLSWMISYDDHDVRRVIINMRETPPKDGWETPRYFWMVGCSPIEFGVNMSETDAWEWDEDLDVLAEDGKEREGG